MRKTTFNIVHNLLISFPVIFILLNPVAFAQTRAEKNVLYITEQYPPFNFMEDGQLKGIAVDILEKIFEKNATGLTRKDIQLFPWARGYTLTLSSPETMLFSTTRTEQRENLFKWVGPIATNRVVLLALKNRNITISSPDDLKKYRFGVIRGDIGEQLLLQTGVDSSKISPVANVTSNIKMMIAGRIDAWAYGEIVAKWFIKKQGYDPGDFETVHVLLEKGDLYYAFHKDTPDSLINTFQQALNLLKQKKDGEKSEYEMILEEYLN